jgi:hypothetical protein
MKIPLDIVPGARDSLSRACFCLPPEGSSPAARQKYK